VWWGGGAAACTAGGGRAPPPPPPPPPRSHRFAAIDEAVGTQGAKIVLLLRLSPLVPFNILNYVLVSTHPRLRQQVQLGRCMRGWPPPTTTPAPPLHTNAVRALAYSPCHFRA